jgi:hypothetical protein
VSYLSDQERPVAMQRCERAARVLFPAAFAGMIVAVFAF